MGQTLLIETRKLLLLPKSLVDIGIRILVSAYNPPYLPPVFVHDVKVSLGVKVLLFFFALLLQECRVQGPTGYDQTLRHQFILVLVQAKVPVNLLIIYESQVSCGQFALPEAIDCIDLLGLLSEEVADDPTPLLGVGQDYGYLVP